MEIKEMIAVLQAFEEGKEIEYLPNDGNFGVWNKDPDPNWNFDATDYRIKPQPTREEITANWVKEHGIVEGEFVKLKGNDTKFEVYNIKKQAIVLKDFRGLKEGKFNTLTIDFNELDRIEPYKETYIPFTWEDRELFRDKWVRVKGCMPESKIIDFDYKGIYFKGKKFTTYEELFDNCEFIDGTTFGKLS